jgi:polyphosphate glucokinase
MRILGIDIGGSGLKGAPVDVTTGRLLADRHRVETPTPATPKALLAATGELVRHFRWRGRIGIGFPGVIQGRFIRTAANLHPDWIDCDGVDAFAGATGCPVTLINDADAAGLAEVRLGAARDCAGTVLVVTLGTGVGTSLFHAGHLFPNTEFGHLTWKGRAVEKWISSAVRKKQSLSWEEWGGRVDRYLAELERVTWPELIVIGGGVSAKHEKFFRYLHPRAPLVPAQFFNEAGVVGAALAAVRRTGRPVAARRRRR